MKQCLVLFVIFLTGCGISCKKDSLTDELKGKWVRIDSINQVITFGYEGIDDWFLLTQGYRTDNDGNQRPIQSLGEFKIENQSDSIAIHWMHSSSSFWPKYYFSFKGSEIEMGNFIDKTNPIIILEKVK